MQVWRHVGRDLGASGSRKGEDKAPPSRVRKGWGGHAGRRRTRQEKTVCSGGEGGDGGAPGFTRGDMFSLSLAPNSKK